MKLLKSFALCAACTTILFSCGTKAPKLEGITKAAVDSTSYALGVYYGNMMNGSNLHDMNYNVIMKAMKATVAGDSLKIDPSEAGVVIMKFIDQYQQAYALQAEKEEQKFFEENRKNEGVEETESGIQYIISDPGNDVRPDEKDTVEVNYEGTLLDGTVFDSSYERGESATFPLKSVITGWREGMQLIGEGGKITLWIPFNLAYGRRQMPDIPMCSTLKFEVELLQVKRFQPKETDSKKK